MKNATKIYPPLVKEIDESKEKRFAEGDSVIVDKGTINEVYGEINFFFGKSYCEVLTEYGDKLPVNIGRLSRN
jgi:hypothetical protein